MLLYLAATYKEYIDEQKLDLYGSKPVPIPRPELYMVYTGGPRLPSSRPALWPSCLASRTKLYSWISVTRS